MKQAKPVEACTHYVMWQKQGGGNLEVMGTGSLWEAGEEGWKVGYPRA